MPDKKTPANNKPTSATLDIRDSASNDDGWTNVKASNGAIYSYRYTGGNHPGKDKPMLNNGSILYDAGGGSAKISLGFANDVGHRYEFADISFTGDNARQLSKLGNGPRTRQIHDECTAVIDAQYHVLVRDTEADATIPCDPMIKNK